MARSKENYNRVRIENERTKQITIIILGLLAICYVIVPSFKNTNEGEGQTKDVLHNSIKRL